MTIDLERARADTPGCREVVHLNNAGAALPPTVVTDAVIEHLRLEATIGGYEAAAATDRVEHTYDAVAQLIGCDAAEVALVENATRAWDMAFYAFRFAPGDRILTGRAEYASNVIAMLQMAARTGARVEVIDDDEHGQVDVADLERRLDDGSGPVKLVAITHVPTHGGLVNPVVEIGQRTRSAGVPYLLDACQSVGQMVVDVREVGCDVLAATGRKFLRGPRGTGFLYVAADLVEQLEPPMLDLHAARWTAPDEYVIRPDARRFETWESNVAGRIGLGVAIDYAIALGLDAIEHRVTALAAALRERLSALPTVAVHDLGARRCGIVSFTVAGVPAADVREKLADARINTSVSLVDYSRLDLPRRGVPDLVRASVHYYNTEDELDRLVQEVDAMSRR
jgi:cysteine desulfurase / selenocysteine lyase